MLRKFPYLFIKTCSCVALCRKKKDPFQVNWTRKDYFLGGSLPKLHSVGHGQFEQASVGRIKSFLLPLKLFLI